MIRLPSCSAACHPFPATRDLQMDLIMSQQQSSLTDTLMTGCHFCFTVDESSDFRSKWSSSLSGPGDVFGCWWKPYFPQLSSVCSQLAAGSGNFLCSCVVFFFKIPYSFLFTTYTPTNTEADDIHSGHILQDGSCCLWHVSGTFLFYPTFIPRAPAMAPLMYNSFLPPLVA